MTRIRTANGRHMKRSPLLSKSWRPALLLSGLAILFASLSHAETPPGRYTITAGVVKDTKTGLEWQQTESGATYTFAAAQTHCAGLGGTWRTPSVKELLTLVDESRSYPAVDTSVFTSIPEAGNLATCYQTSTPLAGTPITWLVCFDEGRPTYDSATDAYRALCVR